MIKTLSNNILKDITNSYETTIINAIDKNISNYKIIFSDNNEVEIKTDIDFNYSKKDIENKLKDIDNSKDYIVSYVDNKVSIRIIVDNDIKTIKAFVQCDIRTYDKYDYTMYEELSEYDIYYKKEEIKNYEKN